MKKCHFDPFSKNFLSSGTISEKCNEDLEKFKSMDLAHFLVKQEF